ncbi:MAG: zinc ribbon domain-containing protein [Candidatus Gastranaerophilales bacterium]|nr:zinc ribbon domain-containing protein [Candidatus Gastranaerophilales bacterium]
MKNKCPNCGYEYDDNDAFCAMCGIKLEKIEEENSEIIDNELNESKEATLDNIKVFFDAKNKENKEGLLNFNGSLFDSPMFNFIIIMILISFLMCISLYLVIQKQNLKKSQMRYSNMIANPALIPELKEPKSYVDLRVNLADCENFLAMYLRNSQDTPEKKEQVFISYLKEMDKLPHITNENMVNDDLNSCSVIKSSAHAQRCAKEFSKDFKDVGIKAYSSYSTIYLYPDYKYIYNRYSKYLSKQMVKYLKLKAKYNKPVRVGLVLQISPKEIADKIYDFEKLYSRVSDVYIREEVLKTIYYDFRTFIFSPSIYATTTQEMTSEFKNAYAYFISLRKNSQLRPLVMSYLDKTKAYSETNFKNDYPYTLFNESFNENVENSALSDIFVQLRKSIFSNTKQHSFTYVYNISAGSWKKFDKNTPIAQGEYIFSTVDENNNIAIYNNTYSLLQELNIPKYNKLFLTNNALYSFNTDRLTLSKVIFNGRSFALQYLNVSEATSVFPGIKVINIDSYQNYNIYVEKDNANAAYIILSRYSQGFDGYIVTPLKGEALIQGLPNMFTVSGYEDIELSFHNSLINPKETSESTPTYKITIHTNGYNADDDDVVKYDEKTAQEEQTEKHSPNMMPKIIKETTQNEFEIDNASNLSTAPNQSIEPPSAD